METAKVVRNDDGSRRIDYRTGIPDMALPGRCYHGECLACKQTGVITPFPNGDSLVIHVADYYKNGMARSVVRCFVPLPPPPPKKKRGGQRKVKKPAANDGP